MIVLLMRNFGKDHNAARLTSNTLVVESNKIHLLIKLLKLYHVSTSVNRNILKIASENHTAVIRSLRLTCCQDSIGILLASSTAP